jgi:uncharacterized protein
MKIIALSDIHGELKALPPLAPDLAAADLVLLAGDLGRFGRLASAQQIVQTILDLNPHLLAVAGNCDTPDLTDWLAEKGIGADGTCRTVGSIAVAGLSRSLPCPGATPNEAADDELRVTLDAARQQLPPGLPHLLLAHQPPRDTKADVAWAGRHVGSAAVRRYVETTQPIICVCGHIHEGRSVDRLGPTLIVNPGAFKDGHYAIIDFDPAGHAAAELF